MTEEGKKIEEKINGKINRYQSFLGVKTSGDESKRQRHRKIKIQAVLYNSLLTVNKKCFTLVFIYVYINSDETLHLHHERTIFLTVTCYIALLLISHVLTC